MRLHAGYAGRQAGVMSLPAESVAAASNAWFWVSDDAVTVETDEYLLVRSPDYFTHPLSLAWFRPAGPVAAGVAAVLDRARQFGLPRLYWKVRLDSPAGVPDLLTARGATVAETLDVLALDLRHGAPALPAPARDVEVRWATDLGTARDASEVAAAVFGGTVPPEERIARNARQYAASVPAGEGGVIVGYAGGTAAGAAGLMMADGVAQLWGGSVVEAARGQGVYRALLAARLDYGVARGATMALVKARVETSGPILRRAGFLPYGQELTFDVPLG
jgi:GNAT superfamily N-acetyltransferase